MFVKPEVTKDFTARAGEVSMNVYESLLDPRPNGTGNCSPKAARSYRRASFIWVVGAYTDADARPVNGWPRMKEVREALFAFATGEQP
jgi:hypothetical protein